MMLAQIETLVPIVDKAAAASDRWLFMAVLVLLIIGGAVVIKFLVNSLKQKDADAKMEREELHAEIKEERTTCRASRKEDQAEYLKAIAEQEKVVAEHTKTVQSMADVIRKHDQDMRLTHELEMKATIRSEFEKMRAVVPPTPQPAQPSPP